MAKSSLVTFMALCGHEYTANSTVVCRRPYCPDCIWDVRRENDRVAAERAASIANAESRGFYVSPTRRAEIYARDDWTCQLCLEPVDPDAHYLDIWSASLDHIICRSWNNDPDHSSENLRLAHRWCNSVRGDERKWTEADLRPPGVKTAA